MQRLFAALDLPGEIREGLDAWGAGELADPALRRVRADSLHMTLCFLGSIREEGIEEAIAIVAAVRPRPVRMKLALTPVAKPPRRPSLLALEAEAPEASSMAQELTQALVERGLAEAPRRPFWPHVTVARVRSERQASGSRRRRPQRITQPPGDLPAALGGEFSAVRLCLYRSMMRRDGSQYVPLYNMNLR